MRSALPGRPSQTQTQGNTIAMFGIDLNVILLSLFVIAAVFCVIGLALHWKLAWRTMLVVAMLAVCALGLNPRQDAETGDWSVDLKAGIDLEGGTSLLYDVTVAEGVNPRDAIRDTIEILSNRVDPTGVRNLGWREEQGNRIEVQMPLPSPEVQKARAALNELEKQIIATGLTEDEAMQAAEADGADFESAVRLLVRGVPERRALLVKLQQARIDLEKAKADFKAVGDDPDKRLELVGAVTEADAAYTRALTEVMATNLSVSKLRQVLARPTKPKKGETVSLREQGLTEMKGSYPLLVDRIDAYREAYDAYDKIKGRLDDPADLIRLLKGSGVLQFHLTASAQDGLNLDALRKQLENDGPGAFAHQDVVWFKIDDPEKFADSPKERLAYKQDPVKYLQGEGLLAAMYGDTPYVLVWNIPDRALAGYEVQQGWGLTEARTSPDQKGFTAISVQLDAIGAKWMRNMTTKYTLRSMCMVLDDVFISHAVIQGSFGSQFQITRPGGFSDDRAEYLISTLNAGSLKARLSPEPIAVRSIGSNLGADNLAKGLEAAIDALIIVMVFMLAYYLFAGLVANVALLANMLIILGVMSAYQAAFTLPGIAGVVLTIGMCVDANVLIYERIREELNKGTEFDVALRLGYQRAFSSIIDSNITNLFVCGILFMTTTTDVKGFATTLSIGICATLFTALFMTRTIFALWHKLVPISKLSMLPMLVPAVEKALHPNINWLGKKPLFFTVSAIALTLSLVGVFTRGEQMLDIEFRAGTEVEFNLAGATTDDTADDVTMTLQDARDRTAEIAAAFESGAGELGEALNKRVAERVEQIVVDARVKIENDLNAAKNRLIIAKENLEQAKAEDGNVGAAEKAVANAEAAIAEAEAQVTGSVDELRAEAVAATNLAELSGATVVSVGEAKGKDDGGPAVYGSFSIVSTVADSTIVSDAIQLAFAEELGDQNAARLSYPAKGAAFKQAPKYQVDDPLLSEVIARPTDAKVSAFRGGVAIVVEGIQPAATIADVEKRIETMRLQPDFENLPYRPRAVFGLTAVPGKPGEYDAIAIVAKDDAIGLSSDLDRWNNFAAEEWALVDAALSRGKSFSKVSNFTPTVAETLSRQAIVAVLGSLLVIVAYIWIRFGSLRYGLAAIAALAHDVTIALGCVAFSHYVFDKAFGQALLISEFKLNLGLIAALLTIIGYSLNDTIVLFDRIRENRGKLSVATPAIINTSINQTISRTLLTSVTTMLAVGTLYIFGGEGVRGFAFALIIGVIVGTYSSIAIASPLLAFGAGRARPQAGGEAEPDGEPTPATA